MNVHPGGSTAGPTVTFWGAAQSVAASMHQLDVGGRKILLDCGRVPGPRSGSRRVNVPFPFLPHTIESVLLSHAHQDHCGNLPHLVRQGFTGPIYCTPATRALLALMLGHSASLQEDEASALRILDGDDNPEMTNLISHHDVARVVRQCVPVPYDQPWPISPDVTVRFVDAGHLLGSAMIALTIAQAGRTYQVTFTGDLGRRGLPLLRDPAPVPEADLLVCECTYGGRRHDSLQRVTDTLVEVVRRTGERGGKILIPAFTLGRTQLIVFCLREAMRDGRLPQIPVFVDSPLAEDIVAVYRSHLECLDPATAQRLQRGDDLFDGPGVAYLRKQEQSRELGERPGPCVIVAASAMCDAGRILRHLKQNIDDPRCSVVLVSYQAPESLGKRLLEPRPTVRIHGREWNLWADVVDLSSFSGHADHNDFLDLLSPQAGRTKHVRLVHGALDQAEALAGALRARGFADVGIPSLGETICLP